MSAKSPKTKSSKSKIKPGMIKEAEFCRFLSKFINHEITEAEEKELKENKINIKQGDIISDVVQEGCRRDKETNSKKCDILIKFKSRKSIGVSYQNYMEKLNISQ